MSHHKGRPDRGAWNKQHRYVTNVEKMGDGSVVNITNGRGRIMLDTAGTSPAHDEALGEFGVEVRHSMRRIRDRDAPPVLKETERSR